MPHDPVYPVFLRLEGQPVVIVGGGTVAAGKLDGLLAVGARVTVVAPTIAPALRAPGVVLIDRAFEPSDLDTARFVIAAATPEVNRAVAAAARVRNLFVNAVDDVRSASAFLGGVVRRGDVTVAISTGGTAPALAGILREALDALLPAELERWVEVAAAARAEWKRAGIPMTERRPLLFRALDGLYSRLRAAEESP
ncbi:MAG: bifunctional precorrin-2 dehydrogenase/sirohydrochlorin ferrochelatase [Kofleriaceae bacterium]